MSQLLSTILRQYHSQALERKKSALSFSLLCSFDKRSNVSCTPCSQYVKSTVALPPSGAARSQVDQGRRRGYHTMKLQNYHSAMFKCTKMLIHPLQPSCDAQDAAIYWQVDQMGHTSQHPQLVAPFAVGAPPAFCRLPLRRGMLTHFFSTLCDD